MPIFDRLPSPKSEALKPQLWFLAIILSPAAIGAFATNQTVVWATLFFAAIGVASFQAAYWWLLVKHPDRLQSEEYMSRLLGDSQSGTQAIIEKQELVPNTALPPPSEEAAQ